MRALDDAVKIIDEISFPIDTNDRQQVCWYEWCAARTFSGAGSAAWSARSAALHLPWLPLPTCLRRFCPVPGQMLNIVNSCIGTKFTMRFGSLIAVGAAHAFAADTSLLLFSAWPAVVLG